jgi:hypothetical protein
MNSRIAPQLAALVGTVALIWPVACQAGSYMIVGLHSDVMDFMEASSIKHEGIIAKVWLLIVRRSATPRAGATFDYSLDQLEINCSSNQIAISTSTTYTMPYGDSVDSFKDQDTWSDIVPSSVEDIVREQSCRTAPPPAANLINGDPLTLVKIARSHWTALLAASVAPAP